MSEDPSSAAVGQSPNALAGAPAVSAPPVSAPEGKRYGRLAKRGVAWAFVRAGVSEAIAMPASMVLARLLSPFDFGVGAAAGFFLSMAARLTNVGFNQALVRHRHLRDEHCSSVFVVTLGLATAVSLTLALSADVLARFLRTPQLSAVMPIAALSFVMRAFGTVPSALLVRQMAYRRNSVPEWVSRGGEAVASISLAWFGFGYWSIIYGSLVGDALNSGLKLALGGWMPRLRFSWSAMREVFSFGTGVFFTRLLEYSSNNLDNLVVARTLGMNALGFYDKAFSTMNKALARVNTGGPVVSFRIFAIISDDAERFRKAYRKVALASAVLSYPAFATLIAAAPDLVEVLYGRRWAPTVVPFQILCCAAAIRVPNEYAISAAQAWGGIWGQVWRQTVSVMMLVVSVAALSYWGIAGAAFGVLLATALMATLMHALLKRMTGLHVADMVEPLIPALLLSASAGLTVVVTGLTLQALGANNAFLRLPIECAAAAVCIVGTVRLKVFTDVRRLVHDIAADLPPMVGQVVRLLA